jgi:hypothetical protein
MQIKIYILTSAMVRENFFPRVKKITKQEITTNKLTQLPTE